MAYDRYKFVNAIEGTVSLDLNSGIPGYLVQSFIPKAPPRGSEFIDTSWIDGEYPAEDHKM